MAKVAQKQGGTGLVLRKTVFLMRGNREILTNLNYQFDALYHNKVQSVGIAFFPQHDFYCIGT